MSRRSFLKMCSLAGLGFAAPIGLSSIAMSNNFDDESAGYPGPYYIVFNASGGWDTTYLMDPKGVDGVNRLYTEGDILTAGSLRFAPNAKHIEKGLSNEDFFTKYGPELRVLNGLDLSVNNHTPCERYMASGKLDSLAYPTFAALVAACHGRDAPLAFLTFGNYSATGNIVPMSRVPYLQSLKLLAKADSIEGVDQHPYHEAFVADRIERTLERQFEARVAEARLPRVERSQNMLYSAQVNSKALQRVVPFIPKSPAKERVAQQADIALAAFKAGVCVSANLSIGQFDSHNNNDKDQMKLIPELLAGIEYTLQRAEELQIREKLVVVMQSEMGRTPTYNNGNGKDHWSIGSMMFLGRGVAGNCVIGATDAAQKLVPVNPTSLAIDTEAGIRIRPEHIHRALRQFAGIDDHPFSQRFPLEIPKGEELVSFFCRDSDS